MPREDTFVLARLGIPQTRRGVIGSYNAASITSPLIATTLNFRNSANA
jgi:hypothetical protein